MTGDTRLDDPSPSTGPACPTCRGRGWVRTLPPLWVCVLMVIACGGLLAVMFTFRRPHMFFNKWPGFAVLFGFLGSLYGIFANLTGTPSRICPRCKGFGQGL